MNAPLSLRADAPPGMHPDEWAARQQLAACYRIFALLGWTEMIYNHITLRVPDSATGGDKQFLINPFGLHYNEVTASNLVKVNLAGEVLGGTPQVLADFMKADNQRYGSIARELKIRAD